MKWRYFWVNILCAVGVTGMAAAPEAMIASAHKAELGLFWDFTNRVSVLDNQTRVSVQLRDKVMEVTGRMPMPKDYQPKNPKIGRDADGIWNDDRMEVILHPDRSGQRLYHFILNTNEAIYDAASQDKSWNGNAQGHVVRDGDTVVFSLSIPVDEIGWNPEAQPVLYGNFLLASNVPNQGFIRMWAPTIYGFFDAGTYGKMTWNQKGVTATGLAAQSEISGNEYHLRLYCSLSDGKDVMVEQVVPFQPESPAKLIIPDVLSYDSLWRIREYPQLSLDLQTLDQLRIGLANAVDVASVADEVEVTWHDRRLLQVPVGQLSESVVDIGSWPLGDNPVAVTFLQRQKAVATLNLNAYKVDCRKSAYTLDDLDASALYPAVEYQDGSVKAALVEYRLGNSVLPQEIMVNGHQILRAPAALYFDGEKIDLDGKISVEKQTRNQVILAQTGRWRDLDVKLTADYQFDGFVSFALSIRGKQVFEYGTLELVLEESFAPEMLLNHEILVRDERIGKKIGSGGYAPLAYKDPDDFYNGNDIGQAKLLRGDTRTVLPLSQFVGLGTDDDEEYRGLGIVNFGPVGWNIKNYDNIYFIDTSSDGNATVKMQISDGITRWKVDRVNVRFGLMPYPFRKYPENARMAGNRHDNAIPHAAPAPENNYTPWSQIEENGGNSSMMWESWAACAQYWEANVSGEAIKALAKDGKTRNLRLIPYTGYLIGELAPGFALYKNMICTEPIAVGWHYPPIVDQKWPNQYAWFFCENGPWSDYRQDNFAKAVDKYGFGGLYFDGAMVPMACSNFRHGCGTIDFYKRQVPTFAWDAWRRKAQRIYMIGVERHDPGFIIDMHMNSPCVPTMTLGTKYLTAENVHLYNPETFVIDPGMARGWLNGKRFGIPCDTLIRPEIAAANRGDMSWGQDLILDTWPRLTTYSDPKNVYNLRQLWPLIDQYQFKAGDFTAYFSGKNRFRSNNENVMVSYYENDRALLLILSNYRTKVNQELECDLRGFSGLRPGQVKDYRHSEFRELRPDMTMKVSIPPESFRVILIEKE